MKSIDKNIIRTSEAPLPIGPYSQAVKTGNLLFVSGQLPLEPKSGTIVSDSIEDQADQCMRNLEEILKKSGCSLANVVKTTIYLRKISDFAALNKVYERFFSDNYPARAVFEVSGLAGKANIEIEAIAVCD